MDDDEREIERLAAKLKRPARLWPTLGELSPEHLRRLADAVEDACRRRRAETEAAIDRALPAPLGALLVKLLKQGER